MTMNSSIVLKFSAPASAPALGPSLGTKWVSIFLIFAFHETTLGSRFISKISVNTTTNFKKIDEIQVIKIKKYARFLLKSCFGDILDKNAAISDKIIAKWPIYYWGFDCAKEIDFSCLL